MQQEENNGRESMDDAGADAMASSRRQALAKLGLFGAVTAPVMLVALQSAKAQSTSPIGDPINGMCTVDPPDCTFW